MNKEIIESYFIRNGNEYKASEAQEAVEQQSIYEVIRVIDGIPLFLEDHMQRLQSSAEALGTDLGSIMPNIISDIKKLIKLNNYPEKNIKLIVYNLEKDVPDYCMYFIKSSYPTEEQYLKGVPAILVHAERSNPNAKIINNELRAMINERLQQNNAYEALLVNEKCEITEGSRSNLFIAVEDKIYTSPEKDVLIGITRKYIIEACSNLGIKVIEQPLPYSMLDYADGVFITGTSPKLLPVSAIDDIQLNSANNKLIQDILKEYNRILQNYIDSHK